MPSRESKKDKSPQKKGTRRSKEESLGNAGEYHQKAGGKHPPLTTNQGVPIADNQNSLRASERGPTLLEDFILREKIMHFDHERIPERIVHARGTGVHGRFTLKKSLSRYTTARLFTEVGAETPVFARLSTVVGGSGSIDTPRDIRGFAVKFYTEEGNYDLVGNNVPVFFIQDAIKFPDLVHAIKMEPDSGIPQATAAHDTFWDFISHTPEAMNTIMWIMSDRTIPRSLRMIEGFGVHSFRFVSKSGKSTFVKFHWRPVLGLQSTVWDEAVKIAGADQDFHRRDMFKAIQSGDFPEWDLAVQLFTEEEAEEFPFDHLDPTKIVPEELVPLKVVGRMVLDRWPDNFFAETEQIAFCPANIIPGIDFSNDPLLQGRLFSYLDTQLSRLGGPNFHQIPINAPRAGVANNQRDGHMQMGVPTGRVAYEPQSLEPDKPRETNAGFHSFGQPTEEGSKGRIRPESFADHYSQARQFYRSQSPVERTHLASALIFELSKVETAHVREAMVAHLRNIDQDLAKRVAKGLSIDPLPTAPKPAAPVQDLPESPATTLIPRMKETLEGRAVGILVADGSDAGTVDSIRKAAEEAGAVVTVVAPTIGKVKAAGRKTLNGDVQLAGSPSVFYDAVAVVLSESGGKMLAGEAAAKQFVADAFAHLKAIAADEGAQALLDAAGVMQDAGVVDASDTKAFVKAAKTRQWERESKVRTPA
jgi:catalase